MWMIASVLPLNVRWKTVKKKRWNTNSVSDSPITKYVSSVLKTKDGES